MHLAAGLLSSPDGNYIAAVVNDEAIVWDLQKVRTVAHIGLDACRSMQSDILVGFGSDSQKIVGLVPGEKIIFGTSQMAPSSTARPRIWKA